LPQKPRTGSGAVIRHDSCVGPGGNPPFPPYPFTSPLPHLLLYFLVCFTFTFLTCSIYFLAFPSLPMLPEYSHSVSKPDIVGGDFMLYVCFLIGQKSICMHVCVYIYIYIYTLWNKKGLQEFSNNSTESKPIWMESGTV